MFIGEVALDMHDIADNSFGNDAFELVHRGEASFVVAQSERHASLFASCNSALGFRAGQRQRFFAPDRFAGCRHGGNLSDMQ